MRDWIITCATAVAAVGAVWAAIIAARAYSRQSGDRHRAQAGSVAAWIERETTTTLDGVTHPRREFVRIRNASPQPIFSVVVTVKDAETRLGLHTIERHTLPPEHDDAPQDVSQQVGTLHREGGLYLVLSFVDNAGTRWRRDTDTGRLREEGD